MIFCWYNKLSTDSTAEWVYERESALSQPKQHTESVNTRESVAVRERASTHRHTDTHGIYMKSHVQPESRARAGRGEWPKTAKRAQKVRESERERQPQRNNNIKIEMYFLAN